MTRIVALLLGLSFVGAASGPIAAQQRGGAEPTLDIYWIDVEGGGATAEEDLCPEHYLKASVDGGGRYTMTNTRNGYARTYAGAR